jgi:energy-coupling factor transport system permease protein
VAAPPQPAAKGTLHGLGRPGALRPDDGGTAVAHRGPDGDRPLGRPRRHLRRLVIGTLPVIASIILVNLFFYPGSTDVIFAIGPFEATQEGLDFGLPIAARLIAAVAATLWFLQSTRPDDLMETLIQRGAGPKLAFVVLSTIQTVPRMSAKARRILEAQQARGLRTSGSARARVRALVPLVGPLVIGSLNDVRERALALEARAFGSSGPRTAYRIVGFDTADRVLTTAAWLALAALPVYVVARFAGVVT